MQPMIKKILCFAALIGLLLPSARAFSLAGPPGNGGDNWQTVVIDYPGSPATAPKNIGEGYRPNTPVMYYAYTPAFLDYFGTPGETNVDDMFTNILNNALSNYGQGGLTSYSPGLTEVPLDSRQLNYTALAFGLTDLKSTLLSEMMVHFGLNTPELDVWRLRNRFLPANGKCPIDEEYTVIQRNFSISPSDYNTIQYSSYVNNVLYTFSILEACSGTATLAQTVPTPVDNFSQAFSSVAGSGNIFYGYYYTGLTSDDIAGMRYLLNPANVNLETVEGNSFLFDESTNTAGDELLFPVNSATPTGFGTYNLSSLWSFSRTNTPATVQATFPGIIVSSSRYYFSLASNATVSAYLAPASPGSAYGSPPVLTLVTNYTPYLATNYVMSFGNVVPVTTNRYSTNLIMTVTTGPKNGAPYGSPPVSTTNYTSYVVTNLPSGDFYLVPQAGTNLCGSGIQFLGLTTQIYSTNLITALTTNLVTATNSSLYTVTQYQISSYPSHTYVAFPVNCQQTPNATGLYQGINQVQFFRVDYDSELGQTFNPFTNSYTMVAITNSQTRVEHFDRLVTVPDIAIDAADLDINVNITIDGYNLTVTGAPGSPNGVYTTPEWDQANILPNLAGPGTIRLARATGAPFTPVCLTLNKVGNSYLNGSLANYNLTTNAFRGLGPLNELSLLAYASFDDTTNLPILYPNGSSIQNLQNELLLQISPTPAQLQTATGKVGTRYLDSGTNVIFTLSGGGGAFDLTDPYVWSTTGPAILGGLAPNSGLPPGLTLSPATGSLTGTPTLAGTYDFTLTFTDYYSRSVSWSYTIIIQ